MQTILEWLSKRSHVRSDFEQNTLESDKGLNSSFNVKCFLTFSRSLVAHYSKLISSLKYMAGAALLYPIMLVRVHDHTQNVPFTFVF